MPTVNIPPALRLALYLISALGSVVAAYLFAKGYVGDAELALWAGVVAIINGLAAAKVDLHEQDTAERVGAAVAHEMNVVARYARPRRPKPLSD